jgi:hypothetical protein
MKNVVLVNFLFYCLTASFLVNCSQKYLASPDEVRSFDEKDEELDFFPDGSTAFSTLESTEEAINLKSDTEELPIYFNDYISRSDLLKAARDILWSNFNPIGVCTYLRPNDRSDCDNFSTIVRGMIASENDEIVTELLDIFAFFLTVQSNPSNEAVDFISELATDKRNIQYLDRYLAICKRSAILDSYSKRRLIDCFLTYINLTISARSIAYLYEIKVDEVIRICNIPLDNYKGVYLDSDIPIHIRSFEKKYFGIE